MNGGPYSRVSSPSSGSSFTTSAPRSARVIPHHGPAKTRDNSNTLIPANADMDPPVV